MVRSGVCLGDCRFAQGIARGVGVSHGGFARRVGGSHGCSEDSLGRFAQELRSEDSFFGRTPPSKKIV